MNYISLFILVILFYSCNTSEETTDVLPILSEKANENLSYFGFTLVDVYFDDPTDDSDKISYLDEVSDFSNIADILIVEPTQDIRQNLQSFGQQSVQAVLHLHFLFFEQTSEGGDQSGVIFSLRDDYINRWNTFVETNELTAYNENIAAFYIGEEPTWNGITASDLELATNLLDQYSADIAIMIIEAYPAIQDLIIPEKADWVGFDHYFIKSLSTNADFNSELNTIRSSMHDGQKVMLVMDSHYIKEVYSFFSIEKEDMDDIAAEYYKIANTSSDIVGILGYHWPSGFEFPDAIGARHLTENAQEIYREMGKKISGK